MENQHLLVDKNVSVDISMLYDISGDDESYICLMLKTFVENMPKTIQKIEQSFAAKDWEALYQSAHYAKSSLSVIKVSEMFECVLMLAENAKKVENLEKMPVLIQKVKETSSVANNIILKKIHELQTGTQVK